MTHDVWCMYQSVKSLFLHWLRPGPTAHLSPSLSVSSNTPLWNHQTPGTPDTHAAEQHTECVCEISLQYCSRCLRETASRRGVPWSWIARPISERRRSSPGSLLLNLPDPPCAGAARRCLAPQLPRTTEVSFCFPQVGFDSNCGEMETLMQLII